MLARDAEFTLGDGAQPVNAQQLRLIGIDVGSVARLSGSFPKLPDVDRHFYRALAATNAQNDGINAMAGTYVGDTDLARKRDSLYSAEQFEALQRFLRLEARSDRFRGIVYVSGPVVLLNGEILRVTDGTLVTEGSLHIGDGASLEIIHSPVARTIPGVLVLNSSRLIVSGRAARLRVDGLVYVEGSFEVAGGAGVEVVGSVLAGGHGVSFRNSASAVVVHYDPAILSTPGLRVPADSPVVAWVASWEELR
jgi:hypothetical protein